MKATTTWVLVADGAKARILVNSGPGQGLDELPEGAFEGPNRRAQDAMADRPGRSFDSQGLGGRHAMEPPTPQHDLDRQHFARDLAAWLDEPNRRKSFDRLAVVAAPRMLGELRAELSDALRDKLVCELDKDLTKATPAAIAESLGHKLAI